MEPKDLGRLSVRFQYDGLGVGGRLCLFSENDLEPLAYFDGCGSEIANAIAARANVGLVLADVSAMVRKASRLIE